MEKEKSKKKITNSKKWSIFVAIFLIILVVITIIGIAINTRKVEEVSSTTNINNERLEENVENNITEELDFNNLNDVTNKTEEELKKINEKELEENTKKETDKKENTTDKKNNTTTKSNQNKYYIKVNYGAQVVNVYTYDKNGKYTVPVKAFVCSTGTETPSSGVYKIPAKITWCHMFGDVWAHYCSQIVGNILFHSVPYLEKNNHTLEYWAYDKLGTKASMGCIRLTTRDAKWIYDNVSTGTKVEFYSSSNPGPLGKPSAQKISRAPGNLKWWDPTDPDTNNPWKNYKPSTNKNEQTNTSSSKENTIKNNQTVNNNQNAITNQISNNQTNNQVNSNEQNNNQTSNNEHNNQINNNEHNSNQTVNNQITNNVQNNETNSQNTNKVNNTQSSNSNSVKNNIIENKVINEPK